MKWTALLAVAALFLVVGQATAAPKTIKGVVVAKRAHARTIVLATGRNGLAVTVRVAPRRVRLGDRVSVVGSRVHVLSHVRKTQLRAVVVKRLAHSLRVASGHSVLTIHTKSRALASHDDGLQKGDIGEFEVEFEADGMHDHGFTASAPAGTVQIEGTLVSVSPLVVSLEGLPIEITVPSGVTLPPLTPGQEVEVVVQAGAGNTFTLVSIEPNANNEDNEDNQKVEAEGTVTDSTTSQITVDAGGATITFAAPAGTTLPVIAQGTHVEARGVTINGVLTLTRLKIEDCNSGDSGRSGRDDGCGH